MTTDYEKALERGYIGTVPQEKNPKDATTASGSPAAQPSAEEAKRFAQAEEPKAAKK